MKDKKTYNPHKNRCLKKLKDRELVSALKDTFRSELYDKKFRCPPLQKKCI